MKNNRLIIVVVAIALSAGAGFFGGLKYQQSKSPFRQFNGPNGIRNGGQNNRSGNNFRPINGEIIAVDDKSITVKMVDGSSKMVLISDTTVINQATTATKADLKTGEKVAVFGQSNTDGSVTAQNIQLNPVQMLKNQ